MGRILSASIMLCHSVNGFTPREFREKLPSHSLSSGCRLGSSFAARLRSLGTRSLGTDWATAGAMRRGDRTGVCECPGHTPPIESTLVSLSCIRAEDSKKYLALSRSLRITTPKARKTRREYFVARKKYCAVWLGRLLAPKPINQLSLTSPPCLKSVC